MLLWVPTAGAESPVATAESSTDGPRVERFTWEELTAAIERDHPLMKASKAGLDEFEAKLSQADWAYFPSFKIDAGFAITPKVTGDALSSDTTYDEIGYAVSAELTMVQPLYTFGKISALKRAAARGVGVGRAQMDIARWELRHRAAQAFMGKLLANELDSLLEEGRGWLDKSAKRMERLRDEDSDDYDQLEHLRLKTRTAEFYTLAAENQLLAVQSSQGLRLLLSRDASVQVEPVGKRLEPIGYTFLTAEKYVAIARVSEPSLRVAREGVAAKHALADVKDAELWPDLVLLGSAKIAHANKVEDQDSSFANDPAHAQSVGLALGVRWNLDVPQRIFRAEEARASAIKIEQQAKVARDLNELNVRGLHQKLANARELIEIFAMSQRAAQGWLQATWDTYDAGFGNFRDVMDALVQFYSKKLGYLQHVFEHNVLVHALSQAIGVDATTLTGDSAPK
ncbi:MAG: outer membrane protein TolC [Myxococcota bacterium]|jgi:outer membrane protein TolC